MISRLFLILAGLAFVVGLAACGGSSESVAQKATEKALKERMSEAQKEALAKIEDKRFGNSNLSGNQTN